MVIIFEVKIEKLEDFKKLYPINSPGWYIGDNKGDDNPSGPFNTYKECIIYEGKQLLEEI